MMTCRQASRLISDALDRRLSWAESCRLGLHLLLCAPCARFRRAVRWVRGAVRSAPADARLPDGARERIRSALERASRGEQE
jgi:hypothetical protein